MKYTHHIYFNRILFWVCSQIKGIFQSSYSFVLIENILILGERLWGKKILIKSHIESKFPGDFFLNLKIMILRYYKFYPLKINLVLEISKKRDVS